MEEKEYKNWKRFWLKNYKELYKTLNSKERKWLKESIYKIENLTEQQKDRIWLSIVRY